MDTSTKLWWMAISDNWILLRKYMYLIWLELQLNKREGKRHLKGSSIKTRPQTQAL